MSGAVVVATGQGDAPATRIELVQNGRPVAEVTRSWIRMARSWELTRQETRVASRRYRDVIEVERRPAAGTALPVPVPTLECVAQDSAAAARVARELDPFGGNRASQMPSALAAPSAPRQIDECIADGSDNCQEKRDLKLGADLAYVGASLLVAVECPTLILVQTSTCIKAMSALGGAIAAVIAANHALERCISDQEAKRKACECAGGVAMENRVSDGGLTPQTHAWLAPGSGRSFLDCDTSGNSGSESPPIDYTDTFAATTPEDTGAGGYYLCQYEIDYDSETDTITVYPLYCYVQWVE